MVLINSIEGDISTTDVVRWLRFLGKPFLRLNENDRITQVTINKPGGCKLEINGCKTIHLDEIGAYWYRRGQLIFEPEGLPHKKWKRTVLEAKTARYLETDIQVIVSWLYSHLSSVPHLGRFETSTFVNKLAVLDLAFEAGLLIPASIITGSKKEVLLFKKKHKNIITKAVAETFSHVEGDYWLPTYTISLSAKQIASLPSCFGPSLFQEHISKEIEIRSFYLSGRFYSMAIFSQNDRRTQTDFRNYNYQRPNRNVPYQLPEETEKKLTRLMQALGFETGSIDLLLDKNGNYYFLEVNPVGQFGSLSQQCNYNLEKLIALYLANESEKTKQTA